MRYIVILTENTRGTHPSEVDVRAVEPFDTLREAKASVKEWEAFEKSHSKMSWTIKKATIYNLGKRFTVDVVTIY